MDGESTEAGPQQLGAQVLGASATSSAASLDAWADTSQGNASLFGFALASGDLVLSPKTELRVSARLGAQTSGPSGVGFLAPTGVSLDVGVPFSQGYAYAELSLDGNTALATVNGVSYTPSVDPASYPVDAYLASDEQVVELVFRNDSADEASASFYALVQASAVEITSAVPEPSQWLLLALGLGLVAGTAHRRSVM